MKIEQIKIDQRQIGRSLQPVSGNPANQKCKRLPRSNRNSGDADSFQEGIQLIPRIEKATGTK